MSAKRLAPTTTVMLGVLAVSAHAQVRVVPLQDDVPGTNTHATTVTAIADNLSAAAGHGMLLGLGVPVLSVWNLSDGSRQFLQPPGALYPDRSFATSISNDGAVVATAFHQDIIPLTWNRFTGAVEPRPGVLEVRISGDASRESRLTCPGGPFVIVDRASNQVLQSFPGCGGVMALSGDAMVNGPWYWSEATGAVSVASLLPPGVTAVADVVAPDGAVFGGHILTCASPGNCWRTGGFSGTAEGLSIVPGRWPLQMSRGGLVQIGCDVSETCTGFEANWISTPRYGVLPVQDFFAREAPAFPLPPYPVRVTAVSPDGRGFVLVRRGSSDHGVFIELSGDYLCNDIDFNNDGLFPDVMDIDALITAMQGNVCSPPCDSVDFNNDGLYPDTLDIDAFLRVFSGGTCS